MARTKQTARRVTGGFVAPRRHVGTFNNQNVAQPQPVVKRKRATTKDDGEDAFQRFESATKKLQLRHQQESKVMLLGSFIPQTDDDDSSNNNKGLPTIDIYSYQNNITIGRSQSNSLSLPFDGISTLHCTIELSVDEIGKFEFTITDHSTNGTYIDFIKIGKGNSCPILDKQILCLYHSKKDPHSNINFKFKQEIENMILFQEESLKMLTLIDLKTICEAFKVDGGDQLISKLSKDRLLEAFKETKLKNHTYEQLSIQLGTQLDQSSSQILPSNVIQRILSYCWYQPFMGDLALRRGDFAWKLSLGTISREYFGHVKQLVNTISVINNPSYYYFKDYKIRFYPRIIHPCNPLKTLYKLEIHMSSFYELINVDKFPASVREKEILQNLRVLVLHHNDSFGGRMEDETKVVFPEVRKFKLISSESYMIVAHHLDFPKLKKLDTWQSKVDLSSTLERKTTTLVSFICQESGSMEGFYHFGCNKFDQNFYQDEERQNPTTPVPTRILTVPKTFFKTALDEGFDIPDSVREIEILEMMTYNNLVSMVKSDGFARVNMFKYLIVYFENLSSLDQIRTFFSSSPNYNLEYSHYSLKPISSVLRRYSFKLYFKNTKFIQILGEDYLAEKYQLYENQNENLN
ncbi:hypothetical protein DFA_07840 [Cavenderia fasciculata]|uniref:FHA domain-containing protein n=1 Tax=Cavenderia fasciculata TaxID=261658 RepID=F4Q3P4_CACFS|nr:uncharacterized protein DFA_07840 [Cavenderia fasciculata]EGG16860.1 hypothetical protein DFA_07840 [Cavenderia fasciculata]|eukprot:XP_004355334.1 hypothetical protein DFA_07840 [Cavenderia fasciculata]